MASEQARELRRRGIQAAKAGQNDQARQLLQQSLRLDPRSEPAWVWLASIARDKRERLFCLQKLLEINPDNETALQGLSSMGLTRDQVLGARASAGSSAEAEAAPARPAGPGVPVPDSGRIAQLQPQIDDLLREYRLTYEAVDSTEWVRKTRRRAGERDSLYLRLYMIGGVAGVLLVLGIIGTVIVLNDPGLRGVVFAPTWTPSFTPTLTPTNTPGFTPTPSPTPELTLTPSPTIDPAIPRGDINAPPVPTSPYPPVNNRLISDAVALINQGQYTVARATLAVERAQPVFSADPYFYEAIALTNAGDPETALERLQEAESRISERAEDNRFRALIDLGFAYVFSYLAENGPTNERSANLQLVENRATSAIEVDERMALGYILLARRQAAANNFDRALETIERGLLVPQLRSDTNLIIERGEIYFAQGEYDRAAQEAFVALYIDPTIERAYLLQIRVANAKGDPGLAVIYAQNYLFFYPGSAEGYLLLGDARRAEGNTDLALAAYTQALAADTETPATVPALVARAELYMAARRYDLARTDLTRAFNLSDDPAVQALRMRAALEAGSLGIAFDDADDLLGTGAAPDSELRLVQARVRILEAADDRDYDEALALLNQAGNLSGAAAGIANEYRARAQYALGRYPDALRAIDAALNEAETGYRHFLRGQILEATGETEAAARAYDWVLTWGQVYPYPFLPEARSRLAALGS